jgi:uncharacterized membrane protein
MILSAITDLLPFGGGLIFFILLAAVAFVAFKALKKTFKMAIRMTLVAVILLIAVVGGIYFWMSSDSKPANRPQNSKTR